MKKKSTYYTVAQIAEWARAIKEERSMSEQAIADEIAELTGSTCTQQAVSSALKGEARNVRKLLTWLEASTTINPPIEFEVDEGGKPVMYYRVLQEDEETQGKTIWRRDNI